jgi:hypothetical protein
MNVNRARCSAAIVAAVILVSWLVAAEPAPLIQAHAHNDYEHGRPLLDALEHGFCSVEADIHLVEGELLVAHSRGATKPGRTLRSLYLEPLRQRVKQNQGRVYANGPEFTLLIDLKTSWQTTYPVLRKVLEEYSDILTSFSEGTRRSNAVLAILTGDRSLQMFKAEQVRYAAYDGDLALLESDEPAQLIPWISSDWKRSFTWTGKGEMPAQERQKLKTFVTKTHEHKRRLRFWGAPDQPIFWQELLEAQVDLINTDNLAGLEELLLKRQGPHTPSRGE